MAAATLPEIIPPPSRTYTHNTQQTQTAIAQPKPEAVDLENNPDAIAIRSAMAILLLQKKKAEEDIRTLKTLKQRAVADTENFSEALMSGQIKMRDPNLGLYGRGANDEDEDEDGEDEEMTGVQVEKEKEKEYPEIPGAQDVVRCPPVVWAQYGVVGESLDKMHQDQRRRPSEGQPGRIMADGRIVPGGEGKKKEYTGIGVPLGAMEKMSTRKGGKR